jgi:hypothetical protein
MPTFIKKQTASELPSRHWIALFLGSVLALSVYYFNYGTAFDEGQIDGASPFTMLLRLLSITLIVWSLRPFNFRFDSLVFLTILYVASATSFLLSIGISGESNDILFFNTLLQLPVLIALSATTRKINYARWLRFIGVVLVLQVVVDAMIWFTGASLWLSEAFIGGVGNPSSFGFLCSLLVAFFLFHPKAGSIRWVFVLILAVGVVMSKSLFAVTALVIVYIAWMAFNWRRIILNILAIGVVGLTALLYNTDFSQMAFIEHKLKAVGALIGLVDYDVDSSASVSLRVAIHEQTLTAIAQDPLRLIYGHLEGKQYWPMDSQFLTYLGSFGVIILTGFLVLYFIWLRYSISNRNINGIFNFVALLIFGLIFLTNRILDYFPIAIIYFMLISMATQTRRQRLLGQ